MGHHVRLYKQVERALKKKKIDEIVALIEGDDYLQEMDKKQRQTVGQLLVASSDFEQIFGELIAQGRISVDADVGDLFSPMPLLRAAIFKGSDDLAIELISKGARHDIPQEGGMTLVHDAATQARPRVVEALYRYGADLDAATADDSDGHATPIQMAAQRGALDVVDVLLEFGAELEQRNWRGEHLVHIAVNTRNMELLAYLVEQKGAEVNVTRHHGKTPLHDAVNRRQADFTAFLIEHGADVDAVDEWGWSPLHLASARGDADSVQLLLDAGADIDARTTDAQRLRGEEVPEGATAEDVAAIHGQNKILECLGAQ